MVYGYIWIFKASKKAMISEQEKLKNAVGDAAFSIKVSAFGVFVSILVLSVVSGCFFSYGGQTLLLSASCYILALIFSIAALILALLNSGAAKEDEEKALLKERRNTHALNVEEDVRFTANRTFENYRHYAPYILSWIGALTVFLMLLHFSKISTLPEEVMLRGNQTHVALVEIVMLAIGVFSGVFFLGQSRLDFCRWLRPVGAWLISGSAILLCSATISIAYSRGVALPDGGIAKVIFGLLAILGAEFITSFIIEFYRPRNSEESRPVFESRLLALFTEPGGVVKNIASALDYQFGFKISKTWIYHFIERAFLPLVAGLVAVFWGFTSIHEIGPTQIGIRTSFGRIDGEVLAPGIYFSLPVPFGTIDKFSCTELRRINIGEEYRDKNGNSVNSEVVEWTSAHGKDDDNFIVAVPPVTGKDSEAGSIAFIRLTIPVEYRIKKSDIFDYAYMHRDADKLLSILGYRTATGYLASCSMDEVMSSGRSKAEAEMKNILQNLADEAKLGVEIVSLAILDAHPPTGGEKDVAASYQEVIGAMEKKETMILQADAYAAKTRPEAEAEVAGLLALAETYRYRTGIVAAAESERFSTQDKIYRIMPKMFRLKAYLDVLEKDGEKLRKFIISDRLVDDVYELNFEEKARLDLLGRGLGEMESK